MTTKKKRNWLPIALVGGIIALVGIAVYRAQSKPKGIEVYVENVQKRTISETVSASGKIFPETEVKISSDVSGEVIDLYVKEGDSVTIGQVLAKIRPDEYQSAMEQGQASVGTARAQRDISSSNINSAAAQIEQLKADRNRALSQLEVAKKAFQRSEKLYKEGVISASEFESIENNIKAAEAGVAVADAALKTGETGLVNAKENVRVADFGINSANARMKELKTSLQKTIITAPVSGIISKLNIEKGERVVGTLQMTGTEMMRIANFESMEVQVDVSENDINKVAVGNLTDIEVDAYLGRKFKGKVTEIANSASNVSSGGMSLNTDQVTNFVVKIRVNPDSYSDLIKPNKAYPFRPGMSASVDIYTNTVTDVLSVPLIAVTTREKKEVADKDEKDAAPEAKKVALTNMDIKEIVFVLSGDTVGIKEVKTGIQDNDYIQVSGLNEGDKVVTGPYSAVSRKLEGGKKVNIVDKDDLKKKAEKN